MAGIDMAEDLPSSSTLYNGVAVNKLNWPPVVHDPRREPESDREEDEARRPKSEEDVQLRGRIAQGALQWPAPDVAWTLGSNPMPVPASAATGTTPPAESAAMVVT